MSVITVAGAGHGGLTAAIKLAEAGHNVTVYDRLSEGESNLDQNDSFDATGMDFAGFDIPEGYLCSGNELTFVPLDDNVKPLTMPVPENYRNITVDRKDFFKFLVDRAKQAGVEFRWNVGIQGPVMLGNRVAGIRTKTEKVYSDLVIDACGVHSPVRNNLPDFTCIDKDPAPYDILHTYRAYFDKVPGVDDPEHRYKLYIKEDGTTGFKWCVTEKDCVDVLIVRFPEITYSEIAEALNTLSEMNPQMGRNMLRGGKIVDIPVRAPMAVLVADGYAAVGDSAFMTYPLKGSGIAYCLKAGTILADAVIKDEKGFYNAQTLWEYEKAFFKEIGFDSCRLSLLKNLLPYLTAEEVNSLFSSGLVTEKDVDMVFGGNLQISKLPAVLKEKIKTLGDLPVFRDQLLDLLGWLGKLTLIEPFLPGKYEADDVRKWSERYNKFFDSIRRNDG